VSSPPGTTLSSLMREKARTPTGRRFAGARFTEEPLVPSWAPSLRGGGSVRVFQEPPLGVMVRSFSGFVCLPPG
jgi:hypothetical protein